MRQAVWPDKLTVDSCAYPDADSYKGIVIRGHELGIAIFTDAETGDEVAINTDGAMIGSVGRGDRGTVIIRHISNGKGGFVHEATYVKEDFYDVIDAIAEARTR